MRDLHEQRRAYGKLTASSVILTESGAHLLPLRNSWEEAAPERDVQAFGALLYQMLTGTAPPSRLAAAGLQVNGPRTGPGCVRPGAMRLALKCLAPKGAALSMQQVAAEIRLLGVLLRQYEANMRSAEEPAVAPTPFLVRAAQPPVAAPIAHPPAAAPPAAADFALSAQPVEKGAEQNVTAGETGAAPVVPLGPDSFGHPQAKAKAALQPAGGNCPKCDCTEVYVSRARSQFEQTLERWKVPICRCHRCYHRYVVFARLKIAKNMPGGTDRKSKPRHRRV